MSAGDLASYIDQWGPLVRAILAADGLLGNVLPVDDDFSWVNQSTTVKTVQANGWISLVPPLVTGDNLRLRVKTAPTPPYTVTAMLLGGGLQSGASFGLCWRESSSGKLHCLVVGRNVAGTAGILSMKFNSPTTQPAGSIYGSTGAANLIAGFPPRFLRLYDDGTNRHVQYSSDGFNFETFHTVLRTDFLTPDEVGFFVDNASTSRQAYVTLASWAEA